MPRAPSRLVQIKCIRPAPNGIYVWRAWITESKAVVGNTCSHSLFSERRYVIKEAYVENPQPRKDIKSQLAR